MSVLCFFAVSTHPTLSADGHLTVNSPLADVSSLPFGCQQTACPFIPLIISLSTRNQPGVSSHESIVSRRRASSSHPSSHCQHATSLVSVLCHSAVSTQHAPPATDHLTVSGLPAGISSFSFRCQHTVILLSVQSHPTASIPALCS
jgi:hypothetical protein